MNQDSPFPVGPPAGTETFTNQVWFNLLVPDEDNTYDTHVYNVNFDPAARTFWHSHPGGQILLVTSGTGFYQEKGKPARKLAPGDVVTIPPYTVHWHGAAPDSEFAHLGIGAQVHLGPIQWLHPVSDAEYQEATASQ
ncbi:MAG: cupin domain-containing protein [Candidatus Syntrophosphaera sp.]|nr:cupin domain-containing protein [Candidatus Syntrophosphaera sp.]